MSHQWLRDSQPISGATSASRKVTAADAGHKLAVRATARNTAGQAAATSRTVAVPAHAQITGTPRVGAKLTAARYGFPATTTFTYRWHANGKPIAKATKPTYTPPAKLKGKKITVKVTATQPSKATLTTMAVKITAGTLKAPTPQITGTTTTGRTVKVSKGTWTSGTKLSYRWHANGKPIPKATKAIYKIAARYRSQTLTVTITGKKAGYTTVTRTSPGRTVR